MKSEKILLLISKLQNLEDDDIDKVENAVNACLIVQNLENISTKNVIGQN